MFIAFSRIKSTSLDGADGHLGSIHDLVFDGDDGKVRYVQVDVGKWLPGRIVPLQPSVIHVKDWSSQVGDADVLTETVQSSPEIEVTRPVSRQMEIELAKHFNWQPYWGTGFGHIYGGVPPISPAMVIEKKKQLEIEATQNNLRSAAEVIGYKVHEVDGEMGSIGDLIIDDETWTVRYFTVDTGNWLPGKKVMFATEWIERISWTEKAVHVGLTKDQVRGMPDYDPHDAINRQYEEHLYDYYGRQAK